MYGSLYCRSIDPEWLHEISATVELVGETLVFDNLQWDGLLYCDMIFLGHDHVYWMLFMICKAITKNFWSSRLVKGSLIVVRKMTILSSLCFYIILEVKPHLFHFVSEQSLEYQGPLYTKTTIDLRYKVAGLLSTHYRMTQSTRLP